MDLCLSCGQPLPSGRGDMQTCSPRCRTRLYRQRRSTQLPPRGSSRLRQGLLLRKPLRFVKGTRPDPALYDYSRIVWASEAEWDDTLVLLNQLGKLPDQLDLLDNWSGEMGYNGNEPPNDINAQWWFDIVEETPLGLIVGHRMVTDASRIWGYPV